MQELNLFEQFTGAILLFGWAVHSSICPFLYSLSPPASGCPISTLNVAAAESLSLQTVPQTLCRSPERYRGKALAVLERGSRRCSCVGRSGRCRRFSPVRWNGGGRAGVDRCLKKLCKVCSVWLVPCLLMWDSGAVVKERAHRGPCSPHLFFKSSHYRASQMLWEASPNLSRAGALLCSLISGFLYEYALQ